MGVGGTFGETQITFQLDFFCTMQKFQQFIFGALKAKQKLPDHDRVNVFLVTFFNLQSLFTVALS